MQHIPSRAASETRAFMKTLAYTWASQQRIQKALTLVSTLKRQLTSYTKPWRSKMVNKDKHVLLIPSRFLWHASFCSIGKVLVHCIMGVSRSATLVLAYLMMRQRLSLRDSLRHVTQNRAIYPNQHFLSLLLKLDEQLTLRRKLCPLLWPLPSVAWRSFFFTHTLHTIHSSIHLPPHLPQQSPSCFQRALGFTLEKSSQG